MPKKSPSTPPKVTALIDGDMLVYLAAFAAEQENDWGDDLWTLHADANEARQRFDAHVKAILTDIGATDYKLALSCSTKDGFRFELCETYKSNRNGTRKPLAYKAVREHAMEAHNAIMRPGLEADDLLGIMATDEALPGRKIICSLDKDFKTVPAPVFNWTKPELGIVEVTEAEANRFHLLQTLHGDSTDGYAGIPGVGPKKAEAILGNATGAEAWAIIEAAYQKANLDPSVALTTARLAYILRAKDYDKESGEVRLWTPPTK